MSTQYSIHEGERKEGVGIYLTTEEVCEIHGIGRTTLRKWRAEGCPASKIEGGYRYLADLDEMWIRYRCLEGAPPFGCRYIITNFVGEEVGRIDMTDRYFRTWKPR